MKLYETGPLSKVSAPLSEETLRHHSFIRSRSNTSTWPGLELDTPGKLINFGLGHWFLTWIFWESRPFRFTRAKQKGGLQTYKP